MPSFCRHNRLVQNCPICAREQDVALRPIVSPGGHPAERRPAAGARAGTATDAVRPARTRTPRAASASRGGGLTVRRLTRETADDYRCALIPGVKSAASAERLADELAFAVTRLEVLRADPPGLYAEVADPAGALEERLWLAFEIALIGPLDPPSSTPAPAQDGEFDPFAAIAAARVSWASEEAPQMQETSFGPRTPADPARAAATASAYRAWVAAAGSQADALLGESSWTPARRFARGFERLGSRAKLERVVAYDLLVTLGRLGVAELDAETLAVGGSDGVTLAAKRILGIGDPLLLERRAADLAHACEVPLAALDLGFDNWERGRRTGAGLDPAVAIDPARRAVVRAALDLPLESTLP